MRSVLTIVIPLLFILLMTASCEQEQKISSSPPHKFHEESSKNEKLLLQFLQNKMQGTYGVYTNYVNSNQAELLTTGHEVLSESSGLLLRYYALIGEQELFDSLWSSTMKTFNMENVFSYRFSPEHNKLYTVNAAVDDLRLIRALYEAYDAFQDQRYKEAADMLGNRFYEYNTSNSNMFDFYDEQYDVNNNFITLCYIDLKTLLIIDQDSKYKETYEHMLALIQNGYLSNEFPFYETRYDYEAQQYVSEDHINMVESLLTVLSLAEIGQHEQESMDYIKQHVKNGTLYGHYTKEGAPITEVQSTAIYAIAAMIGSQLGDKQLYTDSIAKMEQYQVLDPSHELYGGYGDVHTLQAYSFDNLNALLAYAY